MDKNFMIISIGAIILIVLIGAVIMGVREDKNK